MQCSMPLWPCLVARVERVELGIYREELGRVGG